MQTLRKKTSPFKYKHETSRFGGEGQCFKAKLIGILEVSEARGDRMCQEALSDLKMAIRAAGEHKQRITVHIALDGLRLRDEKTGDCLYHHPVHKISFIAQDMTDSRAFGYIFGSPDTGHRFFGIKTDKAASQVVIAMRDLFQVVFALKKKEIELAKQHLEKNCLYSIPLFSDSSSNKSVTPEMPAKYEAIKTENKVASSSTENKMSGTAVANLVDLQLELNSLQQGLHQMEKITPSEPFASKDDPFGDSFTTFPNPILPPPPSSGKERSSRTSESSSIFSPKAPHTGDSLSTMGGIESLPKTEFKFSRDFSSSHEEPSSGEWFTPSNSFFEETTLPSSVPQKSIKDEKLEQTKKEILSQFDVFTELDPLELKNPPKKVLNDLVSQNQSENIEVDPKVGRATTPKNMSGFNIDPFGEDPFVSMDPFAETEFKQDPFEKDFLDYKKDTNKTESLGILPSSSLSKSPNASLLYNISSAGTSPKNVKFNNTFDKSEEIIEVENADGECAPKPPPRPDLSILQINPPPLPPKKQTTDLLVKPPPRPPHIEDSMYDYMDSYETGTIKVDSSTYVEKSPALPIPMRKSKFENDFATAPERPTKQFVAHSFEDDYLTPIQFPNLANASSINQNVPVMSTLLSQADGINNLANIQNNTLEGLDITLSQLTLSGLNELATKLNIPASQLSNMTLVQLTEYLSNVIKSKSKMTESLKGKGGENYKLLEFPTFKADFESNFGKSNPSHNDSFDRYAVFRELIDEEIKQTKIDTEPEELQGNRCEETETSVGVPSMKPALNESTAEDKYAALREIVERDLLRTENKIIEENEENNLDSTNKDDEEKSGKNEANTEDKITVENKLNKEETFFNDRRYIDFNEKVEESGNDKVPMKSPKSPVKTVIPVPSAITEVMQSDIRLNSGSLSDIVSGSSPEVDQSITEVGPKATDTTGESWAIFDQSNQLQETIKEKQTLPSEEGLSPWSSDSKDGNGSPSDYRRGDSESGGDHWPRKSGRPQKGWWDISTELEMPYNSAHRRSTDSYEEEYYECYDRPRRRRQGGWGSHSGNQGTGGHSSSSRDVSPWEEEPKRRDPRESRGGDRMGWSRSSKQQIDRYRERRHTDSWDDEDDYDYENSRRFHRGDKFGSRESDRHSTGSRDNDVESRERWTDEWSDDRRRRRRRDTDRESSREHWCCADWEEKEHDRPPNRYGSSGRWSSAGTPPGNWRDRKQDERFYSRDESPWEDEYPMEKDEMHSHYGSTKRNWKRPNSASEMERKSGDFKSRFVGGSDNERDRRFKNNRRSRSRDSQYSEPQYRHKLESNSLTRSSYKGKPHSQYTKPQFDSEFPEVSVKKQLDSCHPDLGVKKMFTLQNRKKKDSPKSEETVNTFPRKSSKAKQKFESNFQSEVRNNKCEFENNFHIESEPPLPGKLKQQQSMIELQRKSPRESKPRGYHSRVNSLFEDDFSIDKAEHLPEDNNISVIKEELSEENDSFSAATFEQATNASRLSKRLSGVLRTDIKKSESVNIFSTEDDPFDDDFFFENGGNVHIFDNELDGKNLRNSDHKWTDDYNS